MGCWLVQKTQLARRCWVTDLSSNTPLRKISVNDGPVSDSNPMPVDLRSSAGVELDLAKQLTADSVLDALQDIRAELRLTNELLKGILQ